MEAETLSALGHSMTGTSAKLATCTEDGNNAYYTCGNCHKVFLDKQGEQETTVAAETIAALGHKIRRIETNAPSCTESGNRLYYICDTCGRAFQDENGRVATTLKAEQLPALGHNMKKTEGVAPTHSASGHNPYYTCTRCGKLYQEMCIRDRVIPRESGDFSVIMALDDEVGNLMTLELVAPNQRQALRLSKLFEQKAENLYSLTMAELLDEEEKTEG